MAIRCKEPFWDSVVRMTLAVVEKKRSKVVRDRFNLQTTTMSRLAQRNQHRTELGD